MKKVTPAQVISFEFCKMFKQTYFMERRRPTASKNHFNATISHRNYVIKGIKFIKSFIDKN